MRITRIFMIIFLITALPKAVYAGQSGEKETGETSKESECEYITVPNSM